MSRPPSYTSLPPGAAAPEPVPLQGCVHNLRHRTRRETDFVRTSKSGAFSLRLLGQDQNSQPEYSSGSVVDGVVEVAKPSGVSRVQVKIEGTLVLKEIAEGGSATSTICLVDSLLWVKDGTLASAYTSCPTSLPFSLTLPSTFAANGIDYPLPPSYEAHLSGLPGFQASILYSVSATVTKLKSALLGISSAQTVISTPFFHNPCLRPAVGLPNPLHVGSDGISHTSDWQQFEYTAESKSSSVGGISIQLYLPESRTFSLEQAIPFYLVFKSTAQALSAFAPYGPNTGFTPFPKRPLRLQLLRQCIVDVHRDQKILELGIKTDIWRVDMIGEGTFGQLGDGPEWVAYNGEIVISPKIKVGSFKAGGLTVRDFIVLSMYPSDPAKALFKELRHVIPVRLTSNRWRQGDPGLERGAFGRSHWQSSCTLPFDDPAY